MILFVEESLGRSEYPLSRVEAFAANPGADRSKCHTQENFESRPGFRKCGHLWQACCLDADRDLWALIDEGSGAAWFPVDFVQAFVGGEQ